MSEISLEMKTLLNRLSNAAQSYKLAEEELGSIMDEVCELKGLKEGTVEYEVELDTLYKQYVG